MDIDVVINLPVSHFFTAPAAMFTAKTVWNALEGPVRGQTTAEAVGANIPRAQANRRSPGLQFCEKLGVG